VARHRKARSPFGAPHPCYVLLEVEDAWRTRLIDWRWETPDPYQLTAQIVIAVAATLARTKPGSPGAVEGFPPDFKRQVEAIINDAYDYGVGPIEITLTPYFPPSEEEIDASDGRLSRLRNHQTLAIIYDPGQEVRHAESEAFRKIKGAVINTFRWLDVKDAYAMGHREDSGEFTTQVEFWFTMYEKPKPAPPAPAVDDGDVPF